MHYDVAIVGAGLVGQSLALALNELSDNLSIALIDPTWCDTAQAFDHPNELGDVDTRVSALTAQTQQFLTQLGAWQHLPAHTLSPYTQMRVWDGEGTGEVNFHARELHTPDLGHIVENRVILNALHTELLQRMRHASISAIAQAVRSLGDYTAPAIPSGGDAKSELVLDDGRTLSAQLIIGADGAHSNVRRWAGLRTREWDYQHSAIITSVACEKPLNQTAWQRFRPEGPLAMLPLAGAPNWASIVWSTQTAEAKLLMAQDEATFNQSLANAFEHRLGGITQSAARTVIPLRQRHAVRYGHDGVVLLGDAAHTIHPLAGQGVNLGFKDAFVLAQEIARAHKKRISLSSSEVIGRYQRRRETDNLTTMAAMEGFKRLFASSSPLLRLARNQGMRWFDHSLPIKQHIMMKAMGLDSGRHSLVR